MRKMIMELKIDRFFMKNFDFLLEKVESIELLELIKIDFEKRIKMAISAINMKEGHNIEEIEMPHYVEIFNVLEKKGNRYICLIKVKYFKNLSSLAKKFNIDIIWDTPSIINKEKMVVSVSGSEENLKKILELFKQVAQVNKISLVKSTYKEQSILSCLTDKQKEIFVAAKKNGYYDYPRKINSERLANKIGLGRATVVEHIRKAENRIMAQILTGY